MKDYGCIKCIVDVNKKKNVICLIINELFIRILGMCNRCMNSIVNITSKYTDGLDWCVQRFNNNTNK